MSKAIPCVCLFILFLFSCNDDAKEKGPGIYIVTTTSFLADAARNIVKDSAQVVSIMGAGVDPHLYKASQGDLYKLLDADVIFFGGLHLEGKMTEVLHKLARTKAVFALGDELPKSMVRSDSTFATAVDPHVWFDISIWCKVVDMMAEHLMKIDTEHAAYYRKNANAYIDQLEQLNKEVKIQIQSIPKERRVMITAHDAFNYFGKAYGIEVKGLQGISTSAEFGLRDVSDLVNLIIKRNIHAVFVETSVSDRAIKAVIAGVEEKGGKVKIGGDLYSDAMGTYGTPEGTYIGMFKHNVKTIVGALK